MTSNVQIALICVALFYLRRWIHGRAIHHPERQTFDALDRIFQWVAVVTVVWAAVSLTFHTIGQIAIVAEIKANAAEFRLP